MERADDRWRNIATFLKTIITQPNLKIIYLRLLRIPLNTLRDFPKIGLPDPAQEFDVW